MKEQIIKFLNEEKISATKLADEIGVQRSSISHILSGRNKPSYDFIEKMIEKYPKLSADWLISGRGNMYKSAPKENIVRKYENGVEQDLFTSLNNVPKNSVPPKSEGKSAGLTDKISNLNTFTSVNKIERIVFFFSNGEFKEYTPSELKI